MASYRGTSDGCGVSYWNLVLDHISGLKIVELLIVKDMSISY